jgi:hypothetical protein
MLKTLTLLNKTFIFLLAEDGSNTLRWIDEMGLPEF